MLRRSFPGACFCLLTCFVSIGFCQQPALDGKLADADFPIQGEYVGTIPSDGSPVKLGIQVIALGGGKFHAVVPRRTTR